MDTEVADAVDGDDRRLVEAGAVGARHRVTGVVIEEPQPGVRTKALAGQEPRGPHVFRRALRCASSGRTLTSDFAGRPEADAERIAYLEEVIRGHTREDVAAGDAGDLQDALDRQTRQPTAVALDPRQALLGQSRHDDAVVQQRRRSLVRGRDAEKPH